MILIPALASIILAARCSGVSSSHGVVDISWRMDSAGGGLAPGAALPRAPPVGADALVASRLQGAASSSAASSGAALFFRGMGLTGASLHQSRRIKEMTRSYVCIHRQRSLHSLTSHTEINPNLRHATRAFAAARKVVWPHVGWAVQNPYPLQAH